MATPNRVPLIVDPNPAFLAEIRGDALLSGAEPPFVSDNLEDALQILRVKKSLISVLVVGTEFGHHTVQNIIHAAIRFIPGLPVILVSEDKVTDFTADELRHMQVQNVLQRPITYASIAEQMKSSAAPAPGRNSATVVEPEAEGGPKATREKRDQDFAPIQPQAISAASSMAEDVYVRIRKDRYVKVLKKGYAIGTERLERYVRRGIKSFYQAKKRAS